MTKNEQIRQTLLATREKRQNQVLKVYELKSYLPLIIDKYSDIF